MTISSYPNRPEDGTYQTDGANDFHSGISRASQNRVSHGIGDHLLPDNGIALEKW